MKLIKKIKSRNEGEVYPDTHLSFGRKYESQKQNGWYLCLRLPFVKTMKHISPQTFANVVGPCRLTYAYILRKCQGKWSLIKSKVWVPAI